MINKIFIFTAFIFILISFTSAQVIIGENPTANGGVIIAPSQTTSSGGGGGNVTSVTSGDDCIIVNPTTGDVVITFDEGECGGGGGGNVDSVTSGDDYLIFNPTTGNVVGSINETELNITIDSRINRNPLGFINSSVANNTYYLITNPFNFINITSGQFFNDTAFINSVNSSIWSYLNTNEPSWLSTFNATYNNILNQECPAGNYTYAIQSNGTILCRSDNSGSSADFTNVAYLNNTQTFTVNQTISANLTVTEIVFANLFSGSLSWTNLINVPNIIYGLWTTENPNNLLISNGTAIGYNQTILNNSINNKISLNPQGYINSSVGNATYIKLSDLPLENRTIVNCANVTGNSLCQTGSPSFIGGTFSDDVTFNNVGGAILPITQAVIGTVDIAGGLISLPAMIMGSLSSGINVGAIINGLYLIPQDSGTSAQLFISRNVNVDDAWLFNNNNNTAELEIFRQNPFAGGNMNGNIKMINTNLNVSNNVTVGQLLHLQPMNLPSCVASLKNTFGANTTGTYGCNSTTWVRIF